MANDFIGIDIQGIDELNAKLKKLPEAAQDMAVDESLEFLQNVMRQYAPYRYVSRKSAYGVSFFTEKQRRWFFAALNRGEVSIGNNRTQTLAKGWRIEGKGRHAFLLNEVPYAGYVMGDKEQSRHEKAVGWLTMEAKIKKHMSQLVKKFDAGVAKALKKLKLV